MRGVRQTRVHWARSPAAGGRRARRAHRL